MGPVLNELGFLYIFVCMKVAIISDLHLGAKNNSMTWWKSQSDFLRNQFMEYIKEHFDREEDSIICLGDVFDIRASISIYIMHETKKLFEEMAKLVKNIYIVCGNHDTYTEQTDKYCSLSLTFAGSAPNIHVIQGRIDILNLDGRDVAMIPWHIQKTKTITEWTDEYSMIFTHSDIITGNPKLNCPVFSGHVHTPYISGNVRNVGSCFAFDFHDHNQDRYFYIWEPSTDKLERIANTKSIKFYRVHNEAVLEKDWDKLNEKDYIEIYIKYSLLQDDEYRRACQDIRKKFKNCWIIPIPEELIEDAIDLNMDIDGIIARSIPDELRERFEYIKTKIESNECS